MALTDEGNGNGFYMPVAPAYGGGNGGFGFGGDWAWILLLLLIGGNGWGMNGWGGMGGFGGAFGVDFPWLLNGQNAINANTNAGFDHAATQAALGDLNAAVTAGFGNVATQLCGGFAGVNASINGAQNAIAQQMYTNQIADMERSYAAQTAQMQSANAIQGQLAQCCCDNRAATQDVKYTIATEACATRSANAQNTRDIIDSQRNGTQAVLDKLCALELDNVKAQLAAEQRENANLRSELMYARGQASQIDQTAQIRAGQAAVANQLVNELRSCPIPSQPVYGNQPIFTCQSQQGGCGCGVA